MRSTNFVAYFMPAFFMVISVVCLLAPRDNVWLPGNRRFVMSAVIALYAAFRFYRTRKFSKSSE